MIASSGSSAPNHPRPQALRRQHPPAAPLARAAGCRTRLGARRSLPRSASCSSAVVMSSPRVGQRMHLTSGRRQHTGLGPGYAKETTTGAILRPTKDKVPPFPDSCHFAPCSLPRYPSRSMFGRPRPPRSSRARERPPTSQLDPGRFGDSGLAATRPSPPPRRSVAEEQHRRLSAKEHRRRSRRSVRPPQTVGAGGLDRGSHNRPPSPPRHIRWHDEVGNLARAGVRARCDRPRQRPGPTLAWVGRRAAPAVQPTRVRDSMSDSSGGAESLVVQGHGPADHVNDQGVRRDRRVVQVRQFRWPLPGPRCSSRRGRPFGPYGRSRLPRRSTTPSNRGEHSAPFLGPPRSRLANEVHLRGCPGWRRQTSTAAAQPVVRIRDLCTIHGIGLESNQLNTASWKPSAGRLPLLYPIRREVPMGASPVRPQARQPRSERPSWSGVEQHPDRILRRTHSDSKNSRASSGVSKLSNCSFDVVAVPDPCSTSTIGPDRG